MPESLFCLPDQPARVSLMESQNEITKVERDAADKAIMLRCASGAEAAFQELYASLAPVLFSMVFEILRHQEDAEDVLQEVFVQLWKKAGAYDPARGTVFTWAVTIARHKAIDRFRAGHRRNTLQENAATENAIMAPEAVAPADDILMQRDEGNRVRAALREIPAAQSAAIQLAFFSGLTNRRSRENWEHRSARSRLASAGASSLCGTDWRPIRCAPTHPPSAARGCK